MAAATFLQQLLALWKRNLILKRRTLKQTIQEILMPIYFAVLLIGIKAAVNPVHLPIVEAFPQYSMNTSAFMLDSKNPLVVTPDTNEIRVLMNEVVRSLNLQAQPPFIMFPNSSLAEDYYRKNSSSVSAGVDFGAKLDKNLVYSIRVDSGMIADPKTLYTGPNSCRVGNGLDNGNCPSNSYIHSGFAMLQTAIDTAIIKLRGNVSGYSGADYSVEMMAKTSYIQNANIIQPIASLYYIMAYAPFISYLVSNLVAEKERKIKDAMIMMGLNNTAYWFSWGSLYAAMIFVVTLVVVLLAFVSKVFAYSNPLLLILLLFFYGCSIISLSFMITPFFKKARTAGSLAGFCTTLAACLYLAVALTRTYSPTGLPASSIPVAGQWALALLSPVALSLGVDMGLFLDLTQGGMRFDNMDVGEFPVYASLVMLMVDTVLYALIALYLENIMPGGQRRPVYFFLQPSYWWPKDNKSGFSGFGNPSYNGDPDNIDGTADVEPVGSDLAGKDVIRLFEMKKTFSSGKKTVHAVSGISLNIYEGQITALLGHNGAGKTTLINMLTGVLPTTEGTALIYGKDISDHNDLDQIRAMTGVCPQHDILFPELSCQEHLEFYARIRGVPPEQVDPQINVALADVDLEDSRAKWAKELSGGQKRKLSVAIALIGDPKVIFLDEPTAGMDPSARRHLWTLLKQRREGRVIVLTTHFMDEADILADRKAFINKGQLQCCGSSLFLKNRFGVGYHLGMVLSDPHCDKQQITDLVTSHIPDACLGREHGKELTYTLPLSSLQSFAGLFAALEAAEGGETHAERLSIASYGVSMTSLEEVFLKLGEDVDEETNSSTTTTRAAPGQTENGNHASHVPADSTPLDLSRTSSRLLSDNDLTRQQFTAFFKGTLLSMARSKAALVWMILFPLVLVTAGAIVIKMTAPKLVFPTPRTLSLSPQVYSGSSVPVLIQPSTAGNSSEFIQDVRQQGVRIDLINSDTPLLARAPHYMGIRVHDIQNTLQAMSANLTALYNDTAVHSLPITLNLMANALFKMAVGDANSSIAASSKPWPALKATVSSNWGTTIASGLLIGMALAMTPLIIAYQAVRDREFKIRCLLRVSGITMDVYWGVMLCFASLFFLFIALTSLVILLAFQTASLNHGGAVVSLLLIFTSYIPVNVFISACFSFAFDKNETVGQVLPNVMIWLTFLPYLVVSMIDGAGLSQAATIIHYVVCCLVPPYCLTGGLYYTERVYRTQAAAQATLTPEIPFAEYFQWNNLIVITYIAPIIHSIWMYYFLRYLEIVKTGGDTRDVCMSRDAGEPEKAFMVPRENNDIIEDEDEDVARERQRVKDIQTNPPPKSPVVMMQNLRKEFPKRNKRKSKKRGVKPKKNVLTAVRNLSIAVETREVFGLLGPNGAGKTTALNMVIAEVGPTKGGVEVAGTEITSSISSAYQALGYCPQHDPLWPNLSIREHIEVYAAIKGMPKSDIPAVADYLIGNLQLEEHADKPSEKLSGGTKRKLSYCISMLGGPQVVLLDEPSTGMDPVSKRFLWDTISRTFHSDERGAILTTHYMEEADALCSRVGIMINGELRCLGSTQHLKDKFGSGYVLEVKVAVANPAEQERSMADLRDLVLGLFPGAELSESFEERAIYKIPMSSVSSLSQTFAALEEGKQSHGIEEYSFSQSTLEQVFLEFAKQQKDEADEDETDETEASSKHRVSIV